MPNIRPNTANTYSRLRRAGFSKPYVQAILPEWWSDEVLTSGSGMVEFAGLIRQRLGVISGFDDEGLLDVGFDVASTKLKQRRNLDDDKVQISTSLAVAMARTALRHLESEQDSGDLPIAPDTIRHSILEQGHPYVTLAGLIEYCWSAGIPVLRLANTPQRSQKAFGYAVAYDGRFAIIIGLNDKRPARLAFVVAHELGHICLGHVNDGTVLADEVLGEIEESLEAVDSRDREENEADSFALEILRGANIDAELNIESLASASELALAAMEVSAETQIDPGHLLLSHAFHTRDWTTVSLAHRFLPDANDGIELLSAQYETSLGSLLDREARQYLQTLQRF